MMFFIEVLCKIASNDILSDFYDKVILIDQRKVGLYKE